MGETGKMITAFLISLFASVLILLPCTSIAGALDNWQRVYSSFSNIQDIAFGNKTFVSVRSGGIIFSSSDGILWNAQYSSPSGTFNGIAFGGGTFVVVGSMGLVAISSDGTAWAKVLEAEPPDKYLSYSNLYGVAYGKDIFVAVGGDGNVLTSPDGITWTKRDSGTSYDLYGIAYGNDRFIAVGQEGALVSSSDGVQWEYDDYGLGITNSIKNISFMGNHFKACVYSCYLSTNGKEWDEWPALWPQKAVYGNAILVGIDKNGSVVTSPDGNEWTIRTTDDSFSSIAYGGGIVLVAGGRNISSTNEKGIFLRSEDSGVTWTEHKLDGYGPFRKVIYGKGTFVGIVSKSTIITSIDGIDWTESEENVADNLHSIAHNDRLFVAVGGDADDKGTVLTSTDGIVWTEISVKSSDVLKWIAYGNNLFVAVSEDGIILTSTDGITWTKRYTYKKKYLPNVHGIVYGDDKFIVAGASIFLTSKDGIKWKENDHIDVGVYGGMAFGEGTFAMIGPLQIITANNSIHLTSRYRNGASLTDVAYINGTFIAVGSGTILQSDPIKDAKEQHALSVVTLCAGKSDIEIYPLQHSCGFPREPWWSAGSPTSSVLQRELSLRKTNYPSVVVGPPPPPPLPSPPKWANGLVYSSSSGIDCGYDCMASYQQGQSITLTSVPYKGSTFAGWSGEGCSGTEPCTITMDADKTVNAIFIFEDTPQEVLAQKTLTVLRSKGGKVTGISCDSSSNKCSESYNYNSTITLKALPDFGYAFKGWSGGGCKGIDVCTLKIEKHMTVTAQFVKLKEYTLRVIKPKSGIITSDDDGIKCGATYNDCIQKPYYEGNNSVVTLAAMPNPGYVFKRWSINECSIASKCTITMNANKTVTAIFKKE